MKRTICAAVIAAILTLSPSVAFATPTIDEAQVQLDALGSELSQLQDDLFKATEDLESTRYKIGQCKIEIKATREDLAEAKALLGGRMRSSYKTGGVALLDALLQSTSFSDFISRVYYMDKIADSDADAISQVKQLEQKLGENQRRLEKQKRTQESAIDDLNSQIDAYGIRIADAREYYESLSEDVRTAVVESDDFAGSNTNFLVDALDTYVEPEPVVYYDDDVDEDATYSAPSQPSTPSRSVVSEPEPEPESEPVYDNDSYDDSYDDTYDDSYDDYYDDSYEEPSYDTPVSYGYSGGGVDSAYSAIGAPYVWGASGPDSFDCSGLVCWCYGWGRGRTTYDMIASLQSTGSWKTSMDQLAYGDLVFPSDGHVGIYVGNGMMIHAPSPGRTVCEAPVYAFIGGGSYQ